MYIATGKAVIKNQAWNLWINFFFNEENNSVVQKREAVAGAEANIKYQLFILHT